MALPTSAPIPGAPSPGDQPLPCPGRCCAAGSREREGDDLGV
eukprot:CAMPEP_0176120620 /NCGR_PEP_ID=MMETSP0120_2-20121206/60679_1 /TAXON_ID=160619 /ORGANISM="Kryptoperidinium foliaceum, Strain CCMP 1326" /LENGTH=41 /DNA_ID= /DNA_START= /DNA_END= /DNA_ORIENTATION=